MYGFYGNLTLLSFVPKKSKVVLLLSSMHHNESEDRETGKPEIISFYNKTKAGVDTLDQLCVTYTTGRSTRRWPLCLFYCMLDIIGVNSHVIYSHFNINAKESKFRREFLKNLGKSLVMPHMIKRLENKRLSRDLRAIIIKVSGISETNNTEISKRPKMAQNTNNTRCYICPRSANRMATLRCTLCGELICKVHKVLYCTLCSEDNDYLDNE